MIGTSFSVSLPYFQELLFHSVLQKFMIYKYIYTHVFERAAKCLILSCVVFKGRPGKLPPVLKRSLLWADHAWV